jgi:hypothetical protein
MKQHKTPDEKQGKKLQQQFGKKRVQHKKRALEYLSMANFVDQAFGLDKANDLDKQISSNGYHTSSSTPQVNTKMGFFFARTKKEFISRLYQHRLIN